MEMFRHSTTVLIFYRTKFPGEPDTSRCDQLDSTSGSLEEFEFREDRWLKSSCSSYEGLMSNGADPELSSERTGASSLLNSVLCEKGYNGTPTCSGCF